MYIIFDKNSKKVIEQSIEKPKTILYNQEIAICDNIPKNNKKTK